MAVIQRKDGSIKPVKNLGWLLRHWQIVHSIEIRPLGGRSQWEGLMVAHLKDGRQYVTEWASLEVCRDWLRRPVFRGLPLSWLGEDTTC